MRLAIIIPHHNRKENIYKVALCLARQKFDTKHDVKIIFVNHASDDGTSNLEIDRIMRSQNYENYVYLWLPKRDKWSASIPRNEGAKIAPKEIDAFYFLDSDILLPPNRIQRLIDDYMTLQDNNRVIIGSYHYLNHSISVDDPEWYLQNIENYNQDVRWKSFEEHPVEERNQGVGFALACFGGSILIPRNLFFKVGGYDEYMTAGTEDGDIGLTLWEAGATFSLDKELLGWHNYHEVKPDRTENIQEMVKYINEKHHMDIVEKTGEAYRKWGIEWADPRWEEEA